ncbi:MAG TPA: signal peptidase I [Candidatus Limnocylindrales bacterium]|nr:signal peptidase I [Candidatus Limnocylindrales bacterium]
MTRPPRWLIEVVETVALTLVTFFVIQTFVAQPFQVRQTSMERTLEPDEYVLVDKLTPRFGPFERGDIVVLHPPEGWSDESGTPFIKRVIGLPGETIRITDDGEVLVDGVTLDERAYTYADEEGRNEPTIPQLDQAEWQLGPDEVFVMGDHREASADSRSFGPVATDQVVGRAFLRYWPARTFGVLSRPAYAQEPAPAQ